MSSRLLYQSALLLLLIAILLTLWLHPWTPATPTASLPTDTAFVSEAQAFEKRARQADAYYDSLRANRRADYANDYPQSKTNQPPYEKRQPSYFPFNPNTIDSLSLLRMGYSPRQAAGFMNYRRKGGIYRTPQDFNRLGWKTEEEFAKMLPYIIIDTALRRPVTQQPPKPYPQKKDTIVDLNTVDTATLRLLHGIGAGYATLIASKRNQYGGFTSVDQLAEFLPKEVCSQVSKSFVVQPGAVQQMPVNTASVALLRRHPYLTFEQAKAIYDARRRMVRLQTIDQLRTLPEFTDEDITRLRPYLSFE